MSAQLQEMPRIRRMLLADLDAVVAIEREVFLFPWTRGNFSDSIDSGYHCLVLEQNGYLSGYGVMIIGPEEAHLLTLSVAAESQRKGWGERLLRHFIHIAKEQHALSMFLDVRESNHAAARLYERIGFKQIAKRKDYYPAMGGREDSLVMELMLC
jgi:[ribosomal protein S18]-alanine N-acetyltransferase